MTEGERRLAAVLFTDMINYPTSSGDESRALYLLEKQNELLRPIFSAHKGQEAEVPSVEQKGTGLKGWLAGPTPKARSKSRSPKCLVVFENALDAASCAVEIHQVIHEHNRAVPSDKDILLRTGIHVGEVEKRQGEVLGEGVAVASKLALLTEGGEVYISEEANEQISGRLPYKLTKIDTKDSKIEGFTMAAYKVELPGERRAIRSEQPHASRRIAVLPLKNMSPDPNDEYFADGMTEELITSLSSVRELTVIARTSVMQYKTSSKRASEIGRELDAGTLIEGSVRKASNRLRITVQLIDAQSEGHIWAQNYDRQLDDVFAIQSEIASRVTSELRVQLVDSEKRMLERRPTGNTEAYTLYLKGRYYWNERTKDGNDKAVKYFEEATKKDPKFALAFVGLADCYNIFSDYGWMRPGDALPKAKSFAMRALEIDDKLAEAHASFGLVLTDLDWDFTGAEREFKRAIELNPNYATAHQWYSIFLAFMRRFLESFDRIKRAGELDPLSPIISTNLGNVMFLLGRVTEAIEHHKKLIEVNPNFSAAHFYLSLEYLESSMLEQAREEIQKAIDLSPGTRDWKPILGFIYRASGRLSDAKRIFEEVVSHSQRAYISPVGIATAYFAVGKDDEGFRWLEKAYSERHPDLFYFRTLRWAEKIRSDPRWLRLEQKMGFPNS